MAGRLVCSGVEAEVDHQGTLIIRHNNVVASVLPRDVCGKELRREVVVEVDTVSQHRQTLDRVQGLGEERATNAVQQRAVGSTGQVVDGADIASQSDAQLGQNVDGVSLLTHLVDKARQVMPISPGIGVDRVVRVELGANTQIHGLDGPLQVAQQLVVAGRRQLLALETVDADQGETNALDVDIVDLRVDEDVVDIQLGLGDRLVGQSGASQSGRASDAADPRCEQGQFVPLVSNSGGRASNDIGSQLQIQIAGSRVNNVCLGLELDGDETLSVGDRDRRNRQPSVQVIPEQQGDPELKLGLLSLGGLGTINDLNQLAGTIIGAVRQERGNLRRSKRKTNLARDGSAAKVGSVGDDAQGRVAVLGNLLTHQALPAVQLAGSNAELAMHHGNVVVVVIQRVAVDVELDMLKQTLAGILAIADEISLRARRLSNTGRIHIRVGITLGNRASTGGSGLSVGSTASQRDAIDGRGVARGPGNGVGSNSGQLHVDDHIIEEVTKLGDRERNRLAIRRSAGLAASLGILVTDGRKRLKMGIDEQDVSLLNVHQRGRGVLKTLFGAHASDILDALVKQISGHDHLVCLTIVCY